MGLLGSLLSFCVTPSYNTDMTMLEIASTLLQYGLRLPWRLVGPSRDFLPPKKGLILQPGDQTEVLFTTPLLSVLGRAYPQATFDWVVRDDARPLLATHPHVGRLMPAGLVGQKEATLRDVRQLISLLREQNYDTCFIPSRSSLLATIAWQAYIPQRVGLDYRGGGGTHSTAVRGKPHAHTISEQLGLAESLGLGITQTEMAFYPTDDERRKVVSLLVDEIGWNSERPLIVLNPAVSGEPGLAERELRQWPIERFALLGNHLARRANGYLLLISPDAEPVSYATKLEGLLSVPTYNLAGKLSLGEIGALCELAQLYVGNDTGVSYVSVAQHCPTVIVHGPRRAEPLGIPGRSWQARHVWEPYTGQFDWDKGADATTVIAAAQVVMDKGGRGR